MARMIPPYLSPSCTSPGERSLFQKFATDPDTEGWVVLHALDLARHPSHLAGEIDFVVIVPDHGALCLEVKSGPVARRAGMWAYGRGVGAATSSQSPFAQAAQGMHAIRKHLASLDPALNAILFYSAVFFTSVEFAERSIEWQPWQVVDRPTLRREPLSACCLRVLRCAHDHVRKTASAQWYSSSSRPTAAQVARLAEVLRGDFEFAISPRVGLDQAEEAILQFTEEQYAALDILEYNPRVVFSGSAGTGKTFLALEAARRSALAGRRTLLACGSRLGGQWLERQVSAYHSQLSGLIHSGSITSVFRRLIAIGAESPTSTEDPSQTSLPAMVLEYALEGSISTPAFDALVLDDAHELLTDENLEALDFLLSGGLSGGRWAMFGDFDLDAPEAPGSPQECLARLCRQAPIHSTFPLRVNCRATPQLARAVAAGRPSGSAYARILSEVGGPEPEVLIFRSMEEQKKLLTANLVDLLGVYKPSEVVVLSIREDNDSCPAQLARENPRLGLRSLADGPTEPDQVGFTSIHEFRSLEAPAVILSDFGATPNESRWLQVGVSRARHRVLVLSSRPLPSMPTFP